MSKDPLLPTLAGATASPPQSRRRPLSSTTSLPLPPAADDISLSLPLPLSPSSLKDRIIFGPSPSPAETLTLTLIPSSPSPSAVPEPPWPSDPLVFKSARSFIHRSRTAPTISTVNLPKVLTLSAAEPHEHPKLESSPIVRNAFALLAGYLFLGVLTYSLNRSDFVASETHPVVDALYFCIVTMCTIGYGDITPSSTASKIFSIAFVLIGFGFIDILLSAMVSYVLDVQEHHLLDAAKKVDAPPSYVVDLKKGRMRIRLKVAIALGVVVLCIIVGVGFLRLVERLSWVDAFYLSVMSVTTVGYGDRAFTTMGGRMFACIWLLVSTLAVARAFLYLVEARMDKRHREMAKWVLARNLTVAEFLEADIDNNGFVSKSEFVVYKLKEMGKVAEKDILQICDQFDRFDNGHCGKITLFDLIENDRKHDCLGHDIKR